MKSEIPYGLFFILWPQRWKARLVSWGKHALRGQQWTTSPATARHQNSRLGGLSKKIVNSAHKFSAKYTRKKNFTAVFPLLHSWNSMDLKLLLDQPGPCWYGWRQIAVHLLINFNLAFPSCLRINLVSLLKAIRIKKARRIPLIYAVLPGTSS